MEIHVHLFAGLRQAVGFKDRKLQLAQGNTVQDLINQLQSNLPDVDLVNRTFYAAVNQEYATMETVLHDGDEVALLPPVSGGQTEGR